MSDKKILVVDDELHITQILAFKLKKAGLAVVTANDGEEGVRLACEHLPDLIVSDYQMPVVNGFELAKHLYSDAATAHIPILMLTGRVHKLSPSELAKTNIQALLAKPFSAREVLAKVEELICLLRSESTNAKSNFRGMAAA